MGLYYNGNDIGVIMPIWKKKNLPDLNFFDIKRNVYIYIINSTIEKLRCMMERYIIKGGTPLVGEVEISGAKNAALGILAAAIMADETVAIDNLPDVSDVNVLIDAIAEVGAKVNRDSRHSVKINGGTITSTKADNEYIKKIRASYYLLGAFLGKFKKAEVPLPGGCNIGSRPIDQHLKGFKALGADIKIEHGMIIANAEELVGSHIFFDVVSVGATINVMLAAALAKGNTVLENVAKEPHVVDLANMLNSMGANIKGAGTDVIRIKGVEKLHGSEYSVIPDQIEAGTFMLAAAITRGNVLVKNVIPKHLEAITAKLYEIGATVEEYDDSVRVIGNEVIKPTHVRTLPYPGFPTDMQPQMAVALALAQGTSTVTENLFENRFKYVDELAKMGANIKVESNIAVFEGIDEFTGAEVNALDLRAGAALVIAGIAAKGFTTIESVHYIKRGYEMLEKKLQKLGAQIELTSSDKDIQKFKLKVG
jgi:UDP-N-acetylglucosamine 1-carboxyvinyltransferase